jgi:tRNA nucleotidyltransferase (CCA-adding enzyme)
MMPDGLALELLARLQRHLDGISKAAIEACERLCRAQGIALYLVGGAVRDLHLGRQNIDLDLTVEAPVAPLAETLARQLGGRAVCHQRFGTASVSGPDFRLDLAQTRRETYARPGALPTVELGATVIDDLARRDFTINATALQLVPETRLIDPHGGIADLDARLVRALHPASFEDDATRILRAIRYACRLGFAIEADTLAALSQSLRCVDAVSGARLRRELALILREPAAPIAASLADELGVLSVIEPGLHVAPDMAGRWAAALPGRHHAPLDELGFCLLADPRTAAERARVSIRLHLTARERRALEDLVRLRDLSDKLEAASDSPAGVVELLDGYAKAAVWALSILDDGSPGMACRRYLEEWQAIRPHLSGVDLLELGVPPGEAVGATLRRLRRARLEGEMSGRAGEIEFVRRQLAKDGGGDG